MVNMKRYIDNYNEFRKQTSRKPVIPLVHGEAHKRVVDEIIVDIKEEAIYGVDEDLEMLPLGKNLEVIKKHILINYDTTLVPIGETLRDGDTVLVSQNGLNIVENVMFTVGSTSIRSMPSQFWNGSLEEILFGFTILRTKQKRTISDEEIILPSMGNPGQVLIRTLEGIAWADLDITDGQYSEFIIDSLGDKYINNEPSNDRNIGLSNIMPDVFPEGIVGQVLVKTPTGMGWMDVDITKEQYEDSITNTIGSKYIVNMNGGPVYDNIDSVVIPPGIPKDGEPGQILFKTESSTEWKDVEMTNTQYKTIIANTLGDKYVF